MFKKCVVAVFYFFRSRQVKFYFRNKRDKGTIPVFRVFRLDTLPRIGETFRPNVKDWAEIDWVVENVIHTPGKMPEVMVIEK